MNQSMIQAKAIFEEFAKTSGFPVNSHTDTSIDIVGCEVGLRFRWQVERIKGIFITLFQVSEPETEYSLVYLVEFENGAAGDISQAMSNDAKEIANIVRKYCTQYLVGNLERFKLFANYAMRRIAEQVPNTPQIKATKWIRPEW